nr:MAG TPA: hypothetical protein [Caudoviricetes sp.]
MSSNEESLSLSWYLMFARIPLRVADVELSRECPTSFNVPIAVSR